MPRAKSQIFPRAQFTGRRAGPKAVALPSTLLACLLVIIHGALGAERQIAPRLIHYVNPFVGVDGGGNTVPGAKVPFGFANPSPDTAPDRETHGFNTSGYDSNRPIIGFSQTHVSGTGGNSKYGNFRIMPQVGEVSLDDMASPRRDETAEPGYYAVTLAKPNVKAELTATRLVAVHRYTFPASPRAHLLLDVSSVISGGGGEGQQEPVACTARVVSQNRIEGSGAFIGGWNPSPYTLYFSAEFSRPFATHGTWSGALLRQGAMSVEGERKSVGVYVAFGAKGRQQVEVKVGLSFVSVERARENIGRETAGAGFDEIRRRAARGWEQVLSKIKVEGGSDDERRIFYTALYRSHYMPHDVSGENVWWRSGEPHYEDFYCLWDTFRTFHPLLTLIQPGRQRDMVRSLIDTYRHTGWMPDARVAGANGLTQGGSNSDVLVADALVKGLKGVDYETAYRAMVKNAEVDSPRPIYEGREVGEYKRRGYISMRHERSASRTLEYAYNDFCLAQVAKALGKSADYQKYLGRSGNWMNLWDAATKTIRPREADGRWMEPYDRLKVYSLDSPRFTWWGAPYYEGSGYQYSTYVPHDVQGLINRLGGDEPFVRWLDVFFANGREGEPAFNPGLYTHGNEPDILAAFLYIHAGRADKTQAQVRLLMSREYHTGRAGLPGNDDAGTMSSWYVWNAVGLYPNAGQDFYYIGSPVFTRSAVVLSGGRTFTVEAHRASAKNKYIQWATLDGKPLDRAWLTHAEISRGGRLSLWMGDQPSSWGSVRRPPSISPPPAPYLKQ